MKPFGPPNSSLSSRGIPTLRGKPLTDRRIEQYIRMGRYGEAARQRLLAADAEKEKKRKPRKPKGTPLADILKQINSHV